MGESRYKKMIVWQKAMLLTEKVYELTKRLPSSEANNLLTQMRRSAVSIPSNIAEGQYRFSSTQNRQFLKIAYGSCAELETQIVLTISLGYFKQNDVGQVCGLCEEIMMMLNALIRRRTSHLNSHL